MTLKGWEDLKPKKVQGFTPQGQAIIYVEKTPGKPEAQYLDVYVTSGGGFQVRQRPEDIDPRPDQAREQIRTPVRDRWLGTDQGRPV